MFVGSKKVVETLALKGAVFDLFIIYLLCCRLQTVSSMRTEAAIEQYISESHAVCEFNLIVPRDSSVIIFYRAERDLFFMFLLSETFNK